MNRFKNKTKQLRSHFSVFKDLSVQCEKCPIVERNNNRRFSTKTSIRTDTYIDET